MSGSGRLPIISGREVIRALERGGFGKASQRGDHVKLRHVEHGYVVIVPLYDALAAGLMASILRQAHLAKDEFAILLKG